MVCATAEAIRQLGTEELLLAVLLQLAVIVAAARVFAVLFRRIGQPSAVGEIAAGLALGPSLLGWMSPPVADFIFHPSIPGVDPQLADALVSKIFTTLSQIGLILLLFLIGLEFDFSHLRYHGRAAVAISLVGIALPFALGLGVAWVLHGRVEPHPTRGPVPFWGFALFLGVAMSITAIPILGRIMMELNITRTRVGAVTISSAAVDDAAGWILLATIAGTVSVGFALGPTLQMIALTVGYALAMGLLVRPLLRRWIRWQLRRNDGQLGAGALTVVLVLLMLSAIATNLIGIFAIFGAFLFGAILSDEGEFREVITVKLRDIVTVFFLPIFFTYTGLRTNVTALDSLEAWLLGGLVLLVAVVGKFGGCALAAWMGGFGLREACVIGVMMNTRALMELIVINVGYELGVIPPSVFCMLVLMALATTIMTTPMILWLTPGSELEPFVRESSLGGGRPALTDQTVARFN